MTSDEIKNTTLCAMSTDSWLKEIAYQLAIQNERCAPPTPTNQPIESDESYEASKAIFETKQEPEKRKPGRPRKA